MNIKGSYRGHIDLNTMDLQTLFQVRQENAWTGIDSLYHAWILVNHGRTPVGFDVRKFSSTYPNWRTEMLEKMDLRPAIEDSDAESEVESTSGQCRTDQIALPVDSFTPSLTSSPSRPLGTQPSTLGAPVPVAGKRQIENEEDLVIVEDLLQLLIARACQTGIKSEFIEEDSGIVVISDDEE